jgi:hypothetical protein
MTNSVSSNQTEKCNIAAFFSGIGGIELGFEPINTSLTSMLGVPML